jgi:hypothetical protein
MNDERQDTWIYGVVPAGASLQELERRHEDDGLPQVWVVESGDLGAIVGNRPEDDEKATRNQALAHARVLEAAVADAPVVPFRFGIIVPGDNEVASDLLEPYHDQLAELLEKFEGSVQMTLKVNYDDEVVLREIVDTEEEVADLKDKMREGSEEATRDIRVRLGELVSNAVEQRRERDSAEILERLKQVSLAATVEELEMEFMALNAPFLVERDRQEEFERAVEEVAEERGDRMRFRLLGPMPPYNFIEAKEAAWA